MISIGLHQLFHHRIELRIDIDYKNKYRASYIDSEGIMLEPNSSIENNVKSIIGAKSVRDIDGYAESENVKSLIS